MSNKRRTQTDLSRRTLVIRTSNEHGVVARVLGVIYGRGWNIDSLNVHSEEDDKAFKITIVFHGSNTLAEQVANQMRKLVPVRMVFDLTEKPDAFEFVAVLVRLIPVDDSWRNKAIRAANEHGGRLQTQNETALIFSKTGSQPDCDAFIKLMGEFGVVQTNGSGVIAIG